MANVDMLDFSMVLGILCQHYRPMVVTFYHSR